MSLAGVCDGETVRIERILFDTLRDLCHDVGLAEGDVVHCRHNSNAVLLLGTDEGRTIILDSDWARFIQAAPVVPPAIPAPRAIQRVTREPQPPSLAASWPRSSARELAQR